MSFQLWSSAFSPGETIPVRYTCDGDDISPPLLWDAPPEGTRSLALMMEDPDAPAGLWVHWIVYGMAPHVRQLPEGASPRRGPSSGATLPSGISEGKNSWGRVRYNGPCPPSGTHRYHLRLVALDMELDLPPGVERGELLEAMEGHVLAEATLTGDYRRRETASARDRSEARRGG
jgi:Raf kinase inhibitor-like YbhB/YbcL family protein